MASLKIVERILATPAPRPWWNQNYSWTAVDDEKLRILAGAGADLDRSALALGRPPRLSFGTLERSASPYLQNGPSGSRANQPLDSAAPAHRIRPMGERKRASKMEWQVIRLRARGDRREKHELLFVVPRLCSGPLPCNRLGCWPQSARRASRSGGSLTATEARLQTRLRGHRVETVRLAVRVRMLARSHHHGQRCARGRSARRCTATAGAQELLRNLRIDGTAGAALLDMNYKRVGNAAGEDDVK